MVHSPIHFVRNLAILFEPVTQFLKGRASAERRPKHERKTSQQERNKALVLESFGTLFNRSDGSRTVAYPEATANL